MNSDYQKQVQRRAQYLLFIGIVLVFGIAGIVAACVAMDREFSRLAKINQEQVKW